MNIQILKYTTLCIVILCIASCFKSDQKDSTQQLLLRVINVLNAELYNDAHIKGSLNVPFDQVAAQSQSWDKNIPIVVYCSNYQCSASGEVTKKLNAQGFKAYAYEGGTAEWYQLGKKDPQYAVEGPAQQGYLAMVIEQPEEAAEIPVVTAPELLKMMQDAGLLL